MHVQNLAEEDCHSEIATLDIETDGFDGTQDNLIAIGVGYHDADAGNCEIDVVTQGRVGGSELDVIQEAYSWLNQRNPEVLVTYNGKGFDLEFLNDKLEVLVADPRPTIATEKHLDLFLPRQRAADEINEKWPGLEECLTAYDIPLYETTWRGDTLTNARFGEELAPEYLSVLENGESVEELEAVIHEYTASDIEANIALYEADAGRRPTLSYEFSVGEGY